MLQSLGLERVRHDLVTEQPLQREKGEFFSIHHEVFFSAPELLGDMGRGRLPHPATAAGRAVSGVYRLRCSQTVLLQ